MKRIVSALACAVFLLGGGYTDTQANHAGRCEAAPVHMLVPHWVQSELCDMRYERGVLAFSVTSMTYFTGEGYVSYDALFNGDEFIAMLISITTPLFPP